MKKQLMIVAFLSMVSYLSAVDKRALALDFDKTFINKHCNGRPMMCHPDPLLSSELVNKYKSVLEELHAYFNKIVIVTRGVESETKEYLTKKGLFGPGLVDAVYGARDQRHVAQSATYWEKEKVTLMNDMSDTEGIHPDNIYFYDDTEGNVKEAIKTFHHSYLVDLKNEINGILLLNDILLNALQDLDPVNSYTSNSLQYEGENIYAAIPAVGGSGSTAPVKKPKRSKAMTSKEAQRIAETLRQQKEKEQKENTPQKPLRRIKGVAIDDDDLYGEFKRAISSEA